MTMSTISPTAGRLRAYLRFIVAVLWFFMARGLAHRLALAEATEQFVPLVEQALLALLLLIGYAAMGFWLDREAHPVNAQGLPWRSGWPTEAGMGLAVGWALAVACVLPMVVGGGIAIVLVLGPSAWGWLAADAAFLSLIHIWRRRSSLSIRPASTSPDRTWTGGCCRRSTRLWRPAMWCCCLLYTSRCV